MNTNLNLSSRQYHLALSKITNYLIENKEKISKKEFEEQIIVMEFLIKRIVQIENN